MNTKHAYFILFCILIVAAGLRLYGLGSESFWSDEAYSVHHASQEKIGTVLYYVDQTEAAPFGYYVLLYKWVSWFGNSEFSVRFLSVLFSLGGVFLIFILARELFPSQRSIALLASFFSSISMIEILFSQEARLYALFSFVSLLCTYFFILWNKRSKLLYLYLYAFLMLCSLYINYLAIFLLGFFCVWVYVQRSSHTKSYLRQWIIATTVVILLTLPLWNLILSQFIQLHVGYSSLLIGRGIPSVLAFFGLFILVIPIAVVFITSSLIIKRLDEIRTEIKEYFNKYMYGIISSIIVILGVCVFWSFNPLPLFHSPLTHSLAITRYLLFLTPLVYIFIAWFISKIPVKKLCVFLTVFIILANALCVYAYYSQQTKDPWKEAGEFIDSHTYEGEFILLDKGSISHEFLLGYYTNSSLTKHKITLSNDRESYYQMPLQEVDVLLENQSSFFYLVARNTRTTINYKEHFEKKYLLEHMFEDEGVVVYHYIVPKEPLEQ